MPMNPKLVLKQTLKKDCISKLEERISAASDAMFSAQESANSEGKSSAGDKYETSRAMGQMDRDMNARQLEQARRDLAFVQALDVSRIYQNAQAGALVYCKEGIFFLVSGLGTVQVGKETIHVISPAAPLAVLFHEKQGGDTIILNGKKFELIEIV